MANSIFFKNSLKRFTSCGGFLFIIIVFSAFFLKNIFYPEHKLIRNPVIDKNGYSPGHILIVPLNGKGDIGLLNKTGYFEKIWSTNKTTFYGELMDNNKILVVHIIKDILNSSPTQEVILPGSTGLIAVYDDKGVMEFSFEDETLHHDITIKTPTRIFALSQQIRHIQHKEKIIKIIDDSIVEIDLKLKKIIKSYPLLNYFPLPDKLPKAYKFYKNSIGIFHTNSIDYIEANPINGNEGLLITMRNFQGGTVALIDLKTNKLLWQSTKGLFAYPHDGRFTKDGTITVFDNGSIKRANSRVIEMDILTNKVVYEYNPLKSKEPLLLKEWKRWDMFSPYVSGVQKTEKGYLVVSGMQGKIFEISKDHQIVWELPAAASVFHTSIGKLSTSIFKARQYSNFR